ncbi:hypothetical protein GCM10010261_20420 [Streptomyces pilosus]|uniref:hypothetical protein n=1 Tax=Streptomyces pilosus TaxID=28893 RepID=UPI001679ABF5|nr:hypothetical protein [Streptomyces pilosus]GGV45837.1 hypothetical protein GCM10010261_20420 [Streptomyces pilosus]
MAPTDITTDGPTPSGTASAATISLGHLAVHFRPGERALATRFFELLGARVREFPNKFSDEPLYLISMDRDTPARPDNVIFLFALKPSQLALESVMTEHLGMDTDDPHPALREFLQQRADWPESYLHFGLHFARLEDLENAVVALRAEMASDPAFATRIQSLQILRAKGEDGDREIAERMAASPVFGETEQFAYGRHGAQVHIRTDLFATGLSLFGSVVELDFVFTGPGRERNAFNSLID